MHRPCNVVAAIALAAACTVSPGAIASRGVPEVACGLAPSQSKAAAAAVAAMGGGAAATAAIGHALGLAVVAHSSGAAILTGTGGYVTGTLGAAAAAPVVIAVGVSAVIGAATLELVCAPRNHPEQVKKVAQASRAAVDRFKARAHKARHSVAPRLQAASAAVKQVSGDVFAYAFRSDPSKPAVPGTPPYLPK